jgi:hypothetical protein
MPAIFAFCLCLCAESTLTLHKDQPNWDTDSNNNGANSYDVFGDFKDMGRTILSFSTHMQWRKRNRSHFAVLSKSDRKKFDDDIMFEIPRL